MRISTNMIYDMSTSKLSDLQSSIVKTQQQVSTGLRVLTPADDPVAAAAALGVTQALSINDQFTVNRQNATGALSEEVSTLANVTTQLQNVRDIVVAAGNGALDDSQRADYVTQLQSTYNELLSNANARDSQGNYMFGGYQTGSQPFTTTATGVSYIGDQGQRLLQVGASRQMAINDSGSSVFESNPTGNGQFATAAGATNTGSGLISSGSVVDPSQMNGQSYTLTFAVDATTGATTYLVNETPPPATPATPQPYVSGQTITLGGQQINITGAPANGDTFTSKPSTDQSIFTTINNLIGALTASGVGSTNQTRLANSLAAASNNIDSALNNVSAVSTSVGARLSELDDLNSIGSDLKIQYTQTLSNLVDIDPIAAYSSLTQQQYTLQAAQQSFIKISGLSLFNYMN